ncbi:MAG: type II toxin-antitoxin system HipA family toxin, partial [Methyloprofundus sp.]|nr:type II toxin-antitoxin system HipA family toxin [Methyloprofundus sp.]
MAVPIAEVSLWGTQIGVIVWHPDSLYSEFQYSPVLQGSGIEPCPITMPVRNEPYQFRSLNRETYKGLPGMLADVLPDKFGNALIDQWLVRQGRSSRDFSPIERLCYIGNRGMGALEFSPLLSENKLADAPINIQQMVKLASDILTARKYDIQLEGREINTEALTQILEIGTSAGGARAKAVIAWNEKTNTICSGHMQASPNFSYWLIKFDGVNENSDKELNDPKGYGRIEYAYYLCAQEAGIEMSECRLLQEGSRAHFMTKRFDRDTEGGKRHMLSLCGMAHYDFQLPGATSYEQALQVCQKLNLPMSDKLQLFRRMVFNIIMCNHDDHTKNISFIMDRAGKWRISPAYDVTYSYNPTGAWTSKHQMSINGKQDDFSMDDILTCAKVAGLNLAKCRKIVS